MPYETEENLPQNFKEKLPAHAQHIYQKSHDKALEQYSDPEKRRNKQDDPEAIAHKVAWTAVKSKYEKGRDKKWHSKSGGDEEDEA